MTYVWVVISDDCVDDVYVFAREEDGEAFASTYGGAASTGKLRIIDAEMAAVMIAERKDAEDAGDADENTGSECPHCGYPVIDGSGAVVRCELCGPFCCEDHHTRHPSYARHDIAQDAVQMGERCAACAHPESLHDERIRTVGDGVAPCSTCAVCVAVHTGQPDDDEPGIDDELDIEEYDHSRAKEDSRNARYWH